MKRFIPPLLMFGTATVGLLLDEKLVFIVGLGLCILFLIIELTKAVKSS